MAHDETHATDEPAQPREHPSLPPVHDEAADTPMWIPVVGLVILGTFALVALARMARDAGVPEADVRAAGAERTAEVADHK
jgi:hypothetical protein